MRKLRASLTCASSLILYLVSTAVFADVDPWRESYRLEALYQYDAALSALNNISSDNELALLRRGWLNYLKGSHSNAIDFYKKAISKNAKSLDARLGIILPLLAQQRWREAEQDAGKALEIAPWNSLAHIRLMQCEEALKQWSQLAKHAESVYQHYPTDATAWVFAARAYRKLGNNDAARRAYLKVLELIPDHVEASLFVK